jgi:DNA end-binding protein Ku
MSARANWKGSLSIGLLNIPVAVFTATDDVNDLQLRLLHSKCANPINQPRKCVPCGVDVTTDDIVKGYEIAKGQFIQLSNEELANIKPTSTHTINVDSFTPVKDIDLIYFDRPYYLGPNGPVAYKPYKALRDGMKRTGKVALGVITMYGRDHLMAIRPEGSGLVMQRIRERREVRGIEILPGYEELASAADGPHVAMVSQIIDSMEQEFDPALHEDSYRRELLNLIESKVAGIEYTAPVVKEAPPTEDIMEALTKTLEQAKSGKTKKRMAKAEEPAAAKKSKRKAVAA